MKKKNLFTSLCTVAALVLFVFVYSSCTKEGPAGADGAAGKDGIAGTNGTNGADANQTCKLCHVATVVDAKATEYELSKHGYGEAAFEEAGNATCAPCHASEGFKYVCKNSTPATFSLVSGKYVNNYVATASTSFGDIVCSTCHSSLHTTYGYSDLSPLTTVAAVPMTMYGGALTINLTADGGKSNLCVKCHQPRPFNKRADGTFDGGLVDYAALASTPAAIFYDSTAGVTTNVKLPTYRMHVHYGTVGAVYAGKGGIEFAGSLAYTNSSHTIVASCQDCHMGAVNGAAGGHTFKAKGNFNTCNVSGCHSNSPISATSAKWATTRADVKTLLGQLASKINACGLGHDILHRDADPLTNLWLGLTTNNYDGYLDVYSSSTNALGYWRDPANTTSSANLAKPKFPKLTNLQMGAILNFQFCLREYSLGIHNTAYTTALLTNTIDALTAAGW